MECVREHSPRSPREYGVVKKLANAKDNCTFVSGSSGLVSHGIVNVTHGLFLKQLKKHAHS